MWKPERRPAASVITPEARFGLRNPQSTICEKIRLFPRRECPEITALSGQVFQARTTNILIRNDA